jgi:hypothetical protein
MAQSFSVNGKEYLQSNTLAATFGYTPDYIGKLAREEKILGTLVGRQWFIEPESLKIFLQKSEIEKELRKAELRRQRRTEHATHQKKTESTVVPVTISTLATLQAVAVVLCGLFLGGLSWIAVDEQITIAQVSEGTQNLRGTLISVMSPVDALHALQEDPYAFLATTRGTASLPQPIFAEDTLDEIFTTLPVEDVDHRFHTATSSDNKDNVGDFSLHTPNINSNFSDEVTVVVDEEGNEFIEPIFRSQSSSSMLFRLVPLSENNQ